MESDVIDKLSAALSGALTEAQVVYILALIRKLLEYRGGAAQFFCLKFFSDWAFHVHVDRKGAKWVLRHFDEWFPTLIENESRAADGCRCLLLFQYYLEFKDFLQELGLTAITSEWWCEFLSFYLELIADSAASSGVDLGLVHIEQLAIERTPAGSELGYCWKVTLRTGDVKRLPLEPSAVLDVRPTHTTALWLWNGPVAASVGRPEGWATDNEPNLGWQFCMYPLFHTRECAVQKSVFLYGNIALKSESEPTMEAIALRHERVVLEKIPTAKFERLGAC